MEQRGYFLPAVDDYRRVLAVRPDDEWARLSLGELLLHLNRPGEALEHFEALDRRRPGNAAILLGLARCHRGLGQTAEARRLIEPLVPEYPGEALILSELGQIELQDGRPAEADSRLRQALALAPFDRQINYALARCARELGRPDDARRYMEEVERIEAEDLRATRLRREIAEAPRAPQQRCQVGLICLRLGKDDEGVRWLLSALREDPWLADAHEALAGHYARRGQPQLAARHREMARQAKAAKSPGAKP
jgi:predicted Zn-dependent protease